MSSLDSVSPLALLQLQVFATSKDGTKIPMFVIRRQDMTLDGHNPTLLYGYGGELHTLPHQMTLLDLNMFQLAHFLQYHMPASQAELSRVSNSTYRKSAWSSYVAATD